MDWNTATDDQILDADLLIALGMEQEPDEEKQQFLARMTDTVQRAVVLHLLETMNPMTRQELSGLLEENNSDKINQFLLIHVPNFQDIMTQETIKFKRAMLTGKMPT